MVIINAYYKWLLLMVIIIEWSLLMVYIEHQLSKYVNILWIMVNIDGYS